MIQSRREVYDRSIIQRLNRKPRMYGGEGKELAGKAKHWRRAGWHLGRSNYFIKLNKNNRQLFCLRNKKSMTGNKGAKKKTSKHPADAEKTFSMSLLLMVIFYFASPFEQNSFAVGLLRGWKGHFLMVTTPTSSPPDLMDIWIACTAFMTAFIVYFHFS